ncbi:MAG: MFS transporter [Leptospirales bacterium]|nr:MFS transporter [Leptospirales bacterium]
MKNQTSAASVPSSGFTGYQKFIVAMIAFLQFTVILDFMVLSPLGAQLMLELHITPAQFGIVLSVYALSAAISGLAAAGFADKFDRKHLLLVFYAGFFLGTLFCGIAPNYHYLLAARIITGIFGGVISSIGMAIVTDLFPLEMRGRVMGIAQMAFAASQVLGLPIGLVLATRFGWHAPFLMITVVCALVGLAIVFGMKPIREHIHLNLGRHPFRHLYETVLHKPYLRGFAATTLLSTGGFMLMPFGSAFAIHNMGLTLNDLPVLYTATGICSIAFGPLIGRLSDRIGRYAVFFWGSIITLLMVLIYTHQGITPLWLVIILNVLLFAGILSRMISSQAIISGVPEPRDRGAFMSINSSVQYGAGSISAAVAGLIVVQTPDGFIQHYDTLGYVVNVATIFTIVAMFYVNQQVMAKQASAAQP